MQTEEQKQKLDEVTNLVLRFSEIANRMAQKFKVASPVFDVTGGAFQISRHKGTWELLWIEGDAVQDVRNTSMAVKRQFLTIAGDFFRRYAHTAQAWEKTIDTDIESGRKALEAIRDLIP